VSVFKTVAIIYRLFAVKYHKIMGSIPISAGLMVELVVFFLRHSVHLLLYSIPCVSAISFACIALQQPFCASSWRLYVPDGSS
jgi:hypothetical protein